MSESSVSVSPYGIVGQPLTREYLAKQLPMFQHRVPKSTRVEPQFPTSAPPNLPSPPLYPGETIALQQDRVVCLDMFNEPAVGAIYITNFRIIFSGNLISDPESVDVLQDTGFKKDGGSGFESGSVPKARRAKNAESNFVSFVTDPDSEMPEKTKLTTKKHRSGLAAKLGSIRRTGGRSTPKTVTSSPRPAISHPIPILPEPEADATDGRGDPPSSSTSSDVTLESTIIASSSEGQPPQQQAILKVGGDTSPSFRRKSGKAIIANYKQDTVSLDSASISSQSEVSEPVLTASGERCYLHADSRPDQLLFNGTNGVVATTTMDGESSLEATLRSPQSAESASISTELPRPHIHINDSKDYDHLFDDYDHLDDLSLPPLSPPPSLPDENGISPGTRRTNRIGSIDFEKVPEVDGGKLDVSSISRQELWKNSIVEVESDSDSEANKDTTATTKLTTDGEDPPQNLEKAKSTPSPSHLAPLTPSSSTTTTSNLYSDIEAGTSGDTQKHHPNESNYYNFSVLVSQMHYANVFIPGPGGNAYGGSSAPVKRARPRSKSSSPQTPKKPVPLPRRVTAGVGENGLLTNGNSSSKSTVSNEKSLFVESLPANFRPQPPPKPSSLTGRSPKIRKSSKLSNPTTSTNGQTNGSLLNSEPSPVNSLSSKELRDDIVTTAIQSPQGSQGSSSNEGGATPVHTASNGANAASGGVPGGGEGGGEDRTPASGVPGDGEERTPVPPPRRKRKTRRRAQQTSSGKESESSTDVLSPDESISGSTSSSGPKSPDPHTPSQDQSHDWSHDPAPSVSSHSDQSHDISSDVISSQSPDPFSEDDPLPQESIDGFNPGLKMTKALTLERSTLSLAGSNSDVPSSRTSVLATVDSSSNGGQRPYSVLVSPYDINAQFNFPDESTSRIGGLVTLPRGGAQTWSARSSLVSKRQSQRSMQFPSSTRYTLSVAVPLYSIHSVRKVQPVSLKEQNIKLSEGLLFLCRNFHSLKLYIHPHNTYDADSLRELMDKHFLLEKPLHETFCFQYRSAIRHPNPTFLHNRSLPNFFNLTDEVRRLGLSDSKLWSVSKLLQEHPDVCPSYPPSVIAPICTPEMDLIRGAALYCEGRFPTLTWIDHLTGAALLRAASTKEERGQGSGNLQGDEALLQAICGCNTSAKGRAKLYIFTERSESKSKTQGFNNPGRAEQVRTYYYHNCQFEYAIDPPTFKSVRHSFNKLQAMMENKLPDEHYLIALDTTHWLPRVSELLQTACSVCHALTEEAAHVLVCYAAGWDRTTQIVSLSQLLLDPYYRTMDGFQVLIQKEWVWFGHPFHLRHSRHGKAKEDGPMFLQWVDCVWQVMQQCPSAFEFNERFLVSLVEHSYSGMFGTFITDSEREQRQTFEAKGYEHMSVATHTVSFWTWVAMVNAVGRNFYNDLFDPDVYPDIIYPNWSVPCLKLWTSHYCKHKYQESFTKSSQLQRRLEELVATYKRYESIAGQFSSSPSVRSYTVPIASGRPTLNTKESALSLDRSLELTSSSPAVNRRKPIPPPKPSSNQWANIEQYLRTKGIDPTLCKHIELGTTTCQGYLYKQGAVRKNWLQRWFVLDFVSGDLAYFENKQAFCNKEPPKGVIHLSSISKVHQNIKRREHLIKNIFTLETPGRNYLFQAPSIITMEQWVACLTMPLSSLKQR